MRKIGNLAVVCAQRADVLLQISNKIVTLHTGSGPDRETIEVKWDDDNYIGQLIYELNHGSLMASQ